jgi:hypothetical protein
MKTKRSAKPKKASQQPGPKADRVKLDGNWRDAMKKSLGKKKPAQGWQNKGQVRVIVNSRFLRPCVNYILPTPVYIKYPAL